MIASIHKLCWVIKQQRPGPKNSNRSFKLLKGVPLILDIKKSQRVLAENIIKSSKRSLRIKICSFSGGKYKGYVGRKRREAEGKAGKRAKGREWDECWARWGWFDRFLLALWHLHITRSWLNIIKNAMTERALSSSQAGWDKRKCLPSSSLDHFFVSLLCKS